MMLLESLIELALVSFVLIVIPGPSIMFIVGQTLVLGRASAFFCVLGNAIGVSIVAVLLALGSGELISKSPQYVIWIRYLGAAILLMIGLYYIFTAKRVSQEFLVTNDIESHKHKSFVGGIVIGATNPKALIMFGVIVPAFINYEVADSTYKILLLSLVPITIGLVTDSIWVLFAGIASKFLSSSQNRLYIIRILGAVLMIALALVVLISGA